MSLPPNSSDNQLGGNGNNQQQSPQNSSSTTSVEEFSPPTTEQLNMRCTGVKRLLKEAIELRQPNELFCAKPMEDNLFEWHFTVRGPPDTVYADGLYHGRIVLPAEYPMKPPNLILLTPNGRFETNKKICLSISGYHPETWLPSWSIRTALLALVGFMPTHSAGALGGLECSQEERRRLAHKSLDWCCPQCGVKMRDALPPMGSTGKAEQLMAEVKSATGQSKTETAVDENAGNPRGSTPTVMEQNSNANNIVESNGSGQAVPGANVNSPPPAISTVPQPSRTRARGANSVPSYRLLENPLLWVFILSTLFLALFLRRLLLNLTPVRQDGSHNGDHFNQ